MDTVLGLGHYLVMFLFRLISFPLLELCLVKYLRQPYQLLQQQMLAGHFNLHVQDPVLFRCVKQLQLRPQKLEHRHIHNGD